MRIFGEELLPMLAADRRIAQLGCRNALRLVLRPRISRDEYAHMFAFLLREVGFDPTVLDHYFDLCKQKYQLAPFHSAKMDESLELIELCDGDDLVNAKKAFINEFLEFSVLEESLTEQVHTK